MNAEHRPADRSRPPLPPGPKGRGIRHVLGRLRDFPKVLNGLRGEYGDVVSYNLLNRRFVAVCDPAAIREVLVTKQRSFHKTFGYKDMRPMRNPTIASGDGDDHRRRRKLYQPSFGKKGMAAYSEIMVEKAQAMRERWSDGEVIDGAGEMHELAMNVAITAFFGRDMRVDPKIGQATVDGCIWDFTLRFLPFTALLRALPLPGNLRARRAWKAMDEVVYEVIRRARDRSRDRSDLISLLVRAEDDEGVERAFSDEEVRDEAFVLLMVGHDTSSSAMTFCLDYIARNPAVRDRLEEEVDNVVGSRPIEPADSARLPYATAIFQEALRQSPPLYFLGREAIEDCVIGGYFIPKGTIVQTYFRPAHHNPHYFESPGEFRPERWMDDADLRHMKQSYFPFGSGARMCIAWNFATREAVYALASIVQRWRVEAVSLKPTRINSAGVYRISEGLPLRVRERKAQVTGSHRPPPPSPSCPWMDSPPRPETRQ